jgi:hypothetical protein
MVYNSWHIAHHSPELQNLRSTNFNMGLSLRQQGVLRFTVADFSPAGRKSATKE